MATKLRTARSDTPVTETPIDAAPTHDPAEPAFLANYRPVVGQRTRHDGWTAERQRTFLTVLAETGCISEACGQAGVSSRSAYRLRQLPQAKDFADEFAAVRGSVMPPA